LKTMQPMEIERYVMRYLQAFGCDILEKTPTSVTVKLSPEADKELTNRPYYWSFVDRTGAEPETMTFKFTFAPETSVRSGEAAVGAAAGSNPGATPQGAPANAAGTGGEAGDSVLARYFGFVPTQIAARIPTDAVTFGPRRLEQIFQSARTRGRFARLFEEVPPPAALRYGSRDTRAYGTWLGVNFKVELVCDLKRSEMHSLGIHLATGEIRERFQSELLMRNLTPQLPAGVAIGRDRLSLAQAAALLESHVADKVKRYDHAWADHANERHRSERERIEAYYENMLLLTEGSARDPIEEQYRKRLDEIDWQYRPRIQAFAINCGLFHLFENSRPTPFSN